MIKLLDIAKEVIKEDLCKHIGDRGYYKPSDYKSIAIDSFREDNIWKALKENSLEDTSWTGSNNQKVTLKQLLDVIKDYPVVQVPIEKIEKIIIKKDSGGIESNRLSTADIKYPIIIVVDNNGNYKYILDGNHRANKAIDAGLKSISAKLINIKKLPQKFQDILKENINSEIEYNELPYNPKFPTGFIQPTDSDEFEQMKRAGQDPKKKYFATRGEVHFDNGRFIRMTLAKQGNIALVASIAAPKSQKTSPKEFREAVSAWLIKNPEINKIVGERITGATKGTWFEFKRSDFIKN